jgi:acyl CoA:acetate/3-ketoacid CoA transferase beta subunit
VPACTYPLTGVAYVRRVYTDHAVFDLRADGVHVVDTFGCSIDELSCAWTSNSTTHPDPTPVEARRPPAA